MQFRPRPSLSAIVIGGGATVIGSLPGLLTGTLAPQLAEALAFGVAGLGAAFAIQSGVGALASVPLGRVVDRLGAARSVRLAMLVTAAISFLIAVAARSFVALVALLVVGALAKRLIEPAANRLLMDHVGPRRLGLAFGLKQSAPPTAVLLAGLSVPIVATAWGWQGAYAIAGVLAVGVAAAVWRRSSSTRRPHTDPTAASDDQPTEAGPDRRTLLTLTIAFGLANGASVTVPVFYVSAAVFAGTSPAAAGVMLAVASSVAIGMRLLLGVVTDRLVDGHLRLCGAMLASGALGFALLATGHPVLVTIGVILALAGAWGFSGVFWFTMVRSNPSAAGTVTGKVAPGALIANSLSPLIFGVIAERTSFALGWGFAGAMAALAAAGMVLGDRGMARSRGGP